MQGDCPSHFIYFVTVRAPREKKKEREGEREVTGTEHQLLPSYYTSAKVFILLPLSLHAT